jgi:hypothetical protein
VSSLSATWGTTVDGEQSRSGQHSKLREDGKEGAYWAYPNFISSSEQNKMWATISDVWVLPHNIYLEKSYAGEWMGNSSSTICLW